MHSISERAEPDTTNPQNAGDRYRGTPLGVEAAWCPNGIDLPPPAGEKPMQSMEV